MAATFTWTVLNVDVSAALMGGHDDIVTTVYWSCSGEQTSDGVTYTANLSRSTRIPFRPETWVPYADLTEVLVLSWVFDSRIVDIPSKDGVPATVVLLKDDVESEIQHAIDVQIAAAVPQYTSPPLPWA